jgi:xylulokinase
MTAFLGIDVGTSSVKAVLIDQAQRLLAEGSAPLAISRPREHWSEQDPNDWWRATQTAMAAIRAFAPEALAEVAAIGLSGQQHGATLLDASGGVLRPAILWNDGRSARECRDLLEMVPDFTTRCANTTMPGFTAPKLLWVSRHEPEIFARIAKVLLPKDYVRYRMTGAYVSDMSDAAGTLWLDVAHRRWDDALLAATRMNSDQMPDLVEGSDVSASLSPDIAAAWGIGRRSVQVAGGGGDNACSAVGIGAVAAGDGFLSVGTSGVAFVVTDHPVALPERTLHAFCHALRGRWHGMTVALSAASALDWIAGVTGSSNDVAGLVARAESFAADPAARAAAPVFLPYLTGERTPHNDPEASAAFAGLRIGHGPAALAYAVMEGVAFALADGLDVLTAAGAAPRSCVLVGGGARSAFWAQMIADATRVAFDIPDGAELGAAFGAARLGMLAAGMSESEVCIKRPVRRRIEPGSVDLSARRARMLGLYPAG